MTAQIIPVAVFDLVVFGATGDLSFRKLMPALYWRESDQQMPEGSRIIGVARTQLTTADYVAQVEAACRRHVGDSFDEAVFARFAQRITYVPLDVATSEHWAALAAGAGRRRGPAPPVLPRYLARPVRPDLRGCRRRRDRHAATRGWSWRSRSAAISPPRSASTTRSAGCSTRSQVYRIDHYLGKESVQNLLALRFANSLFEAVWNRAHIDHVQITVAETVGVEERAAYYDKSGALRDMVQNHILQLLCLVAMEPPTSMAADSVRDEKLKVLRSLRIVTDGDALQKTVRGQYRAGAGGGMAVPGYAEELGAPSRTETFVAHQGRGRELALGRHAVLPAHRQAPADPRVGDRHPVPQGAALDLPARRRPGRAQPADHPPAAGRRHPARADGQGPGPGGMRLRMAPLDIRFADAFKVRYPDAYERLLMDVVRGNATLFMRRDEVEAAWRWVEPILEAWGASEEAPKPYLAGSWGPTAAIALIERDGRTWFEETH